LRLKIINRLSVISERVSIPTDVTISADPSGIFKNFLPVLLLASVVLIAKLWMSFNVYGTNDITSWIIFADTIQQSGTFKIYSLIPLYNHPPLMSWVLLLIRMIETNSGLGFPFLFRLMPIFADFASVFVIWQLLKMYKIKNATVICIICSINPINFLVSGFHGNTDAVYMFLILTAVYLIKKNHIILSGTIYGLSMCVKIFPALLFPAFLLYLIGDKAKIKFILFSSIIPVIVFLPYLISDFNSVIKNIIGYNGLHGLWGLGHIFVSIFSNEAADIGIRELAFKGFYFHIKYCKIILFMIIVTLLVDLTWKKKLNVLEGVFLTFCLFLALTPGFGVQYLSLLSFLAVMVLPVLGFVYLMVGGFFLYRVYSFWGGSVSPYYAHAHFIGKFIWPGFEQTYIGKSLWLGFEQTLDIILWAVVVLMLVKFLFNKYVQCCPK
jgi:hypothetical protein